MADDRKTATPISAAETLKQVAAAAPKSGEDSYQAMRQAGGRAWQLHAAMRAADHYISQDSAADRNTGSWLVACAVDLAEEVAAELDALARALKERTVDGSAPSTLQRLRTRSYKLHAAARAADHFLDQDTGEDRSTASWLVACALDLAGKLAAHIDDEAGQFKRGGSEPAAPFSDVVASRKPSAPIREAISR